MIKSMTGFGKAEKSNAEKKIVVEIKSLNSKQADVSIRMPNEYGQKEIAIRNKVAKNLKRGKIYCQISVENKSGDSPVKINKKLAGNYIKELQDIAKKSDLANSNIDYIAIATRLPEVVTNNLEEVSDKELAILMEAIELALIEINNFRQEEGDVLAVDFKKRIGKILNMLNDIKPYEEERIVRIREKLETELSKYSEKLNVDTNRFEQELIFYLEKFDITEEKIRLRKHCDYFMTTLENNDNEKGKKLGFVAQEIGREVNTIGSKANHAEIQKIVIQMKDELEKIKEQMMNIL